ncbi:DUF808 domain-containing protein [Sphingomonas sp. RS6]
MAGGLIALLDDVAAIAKLAGSTLDDVAAAAGRASGKATGVLIDDAAVTPRYVVGLSPERELPIIWKIMLGSLRNKLLIILPVALLLSSIAPWAITPLLMIGGSYLCYEAAEKIIEALLGTHAADAAATIESPAELEARQVKGAIRTDLILSAEIMGIALSQLSSLGLWTRAGALAAVAVVITIGLYGVVAVIVKMDDIGLRLSGRPSRLPALIGRGLVRGMPVLLQALSHIGVAAMVWVGGGILLHSLEVFGLDTLPHAVEHVSSAVGRAVGWGGGVLAWLVSAGGAAVVGLVVGAAIVAVLHVVPRRAAHGHEAA